MDKNKSIESLQFFATGLSNGAFVHKVEGRMMKSAGFTKPPSLASRTGFPLSSKRSYSLIRKYSIAIA